MKKLLFVFIFIIGAGATAMAQSMLRISLADRSPITVSVDGRYFSKKGQSVTVGDLPEGRHKVQIYMITTNRRGVQRERMIYEGFAVTYYGQKTIFTYDYTTNAEDVIAQDMNAPTPAPVPNAPVDNSQPGYGNNQGYNNTDNNQGYNNNTQPQNNDNYVPDNNNGQPVASPVTDQTTTAGKNKLAKLKKKVMEKKTDTEKLTVVKESLKQEMIICDQIATIMDWFSFESSKVEFAEWAYDHTSDPENFSLVSDKLTYNNYRDELDKFVNSKKK